MNWGVFINAIISFVIVAWVVFLVVKAINRMQREEPAAAPITKDCPYCATAIPLAANRCPHCTSQL
jgi:large conductance mechanosensitive channel